MKILATGDWHFHPYKAHATIREGINSRLADIRDTWLEALKLAVEEGCRVMTISGDLFHVRGSLKPSVINVVQRLVEYTVFNGLEVVIIAGNHDMEDYKGGPTATDFLEKMTGVYVLAAGEVVTIEDVKFGGIPYQRDNCDFVSKVQSIILTHKPDVVLMHQGIDDFKPAAMPDFGLSLAKVQELFGSVLVFCGHYHIPNHKARVVQVGAPVQHTFGDENQERGVWIYDTAADNGVFHPLSTAPKFLTFEDKGSLAYSKGDFVRIRTSDPKRAAMMVKEIEGKVADIVVVCRKDFKVEEGRTTIEAGTVIDMLIQYIAATPELKDQGPAIIELYNEVCV